MAGSILVSNLGPTGPQGDTGPALYTYYNASGTIVYPDIYVGGSQPVGEVGDIWISF